MESEEKRKPVLTIVSAALFVALIFISAALFIFFFSAYIYGVIIVATILWIATFVLVILSRKDRIKKAMIPLLIFTIVFGVADLFVASLAMVRGGIEDNHQSFIDSTIAKATIENAKAAMPSKGLTLHTPEIEDSPFRYFDDDGKIAEKFNSIEYTFQSNGYDEHTRFEHPGQIYFSLTSDLHVVLSNNADYAYVTVCVYAERGMLAGGGGYVIGYKDYSISKQDMAELKGLINGKIAEQKSAYEAKEAEIKATLTFPQVFESFSMEGRDLLFSYYDKDNPKGDVSRQADPNKEILQTLKAIDTSSWEAIEGVSIYGQKGFYYWSTGETPYMLRYRADGRYIRIERNYVDPYDKARSVYAYFALNEEDDQALMGTVARLLQEKAQIDSSSSLG